MFQSAKLTALLAQVAALEADKLALTAQVADALAKESTASAALVDMQAQRDNLIEEHAAALVAKEAEIRATVAGAIQSGIIDGLASAGVPESHLPAAAHGAAKPEATLEDLAAQAEAETNPVKAGIIANQMLDLRQKLHGQGRN
jgi:hypothetical protein